MESVYEMVPAGPRPLYFMVPALVLLVVVFIVLGITTLGSQRATFRVAETALVLRGDLYGRALPLDQLRLDSARVVDLRMEPSLRPRRRTAGTGLPGYQAGWFRLQNGEKALLYLTRRERALYIPTQAGYALLLSPDRPDEMLGALRSRIAR
jgi:hypothetical protein